MSYNFNYKESINGIKSSLFDIYENQEIEIGLEQNPKKKNDRLNKFIEIKDLALLLIEGIEDLYNVETNSYQEKKLTNPEIPEETAESKILNLVENSQNQSIKEEEISQINTKEQANDEVTSFQKYYLNCDMKDVNFAYVPKKLYEKIKNHKELVSTDDDTKELVQENQDQKTLNNINFYKEDKEKPRGIIVRNDQYMKLALSKRRQEGVVQEARKFHKEELNKQRKENQKKELEKAVVKFDI